MNKEREAELPFPHHTNECLDKFFDAIHSFANKLLNATNSTQSNNSNDFPERQRLRTLPARLWGGAPSYVGRISGRNWRVLDLGEPRNPNSEQRHPPT